MKIILIFIICFIQITVNVAQITITNQQMNQPNDTVYWSYLDTTGFSPGNSGASVLWDYSNIAITQLNASVQAYFSVSSPGCIPNAVNMYSKSISPFPDYYKDYSFVDSTQYIYKGWCNSDPNPCFGGTRTYTDPPVEMVFPFNYLDSFTDSSIGVMQGGCYTVWQSNGTQTKHYDAYGELRLPWIILPNTARVQSSYYRKDTVTNSPSGGDVWITSGVVYAWYDLNTRNAVLVYSDFTYTSIYANGSPSTTSFYKGVSTQANIPLGITEHPSKISFKIFPNPSNGFVNIDIPLQFQNEKLLQLMVYDFNGRVVMDKKIPGNINTKELNLSENTKGLYCISLSNGKVIATSNLAVE